MSKYLETKLLKALRNPSSNSDGLVEEGIKSIKEKIVDVEVEGGFQPFLEDVKHQPRYEGTELADVAVDVYKNNIKKEEKEEVVETLTSQGIKNNYSAIARSLAGMRNGGNSGRPSVPAGDNGGNKGIPHVNSANDIARMTVEEYSEYLTNKNLVEEVEEEETTEPELLVEADGPVKELESQLMELNDTSWQSIDKIMRVIAKEHDITPKQLHKDFKSAHGGKIPDEWIKEHQQTEECGWFPINEATLMKQGAAYDVNMIYKGQTTRLKFFWPELSYPSRDEMQEAASKFYPGSRLIAYYPTLEEDDQFMVLVPPLTENYEYVPMEAWTELSEETQDVLQLIEEEEGEIVSGVEVNDDGALTFFISDHETGEEREVIVEGYSENWSNAEKRVRSDQQKRKNKFFVTKKPTTDPKDRPYLGRDKTSTKGFEEEVIYEDDMKGMSQKSGDKRSTESGAGLTAKGVAKYRAKNPGSKLKTAVTTPPSKLKAGSKAAGRRKSFCARSRGWNGERGKAARRRWNC